MELSGSTKKLIEKTKNGEKVVQVVLLQCKLTDNQYQKGKTEVLYTFRPTDHMLICQTLKQTI